MTRRRLLLALVLLLSSTAAYATQSYLAFEQITIAGTAIGPTAATVTAGNGHPQATWAICRLETAEVRYRIDGTAATASVGALLEVGDVLTLSDPTLIQSLSLIRTTSTSGVLSCQYGAP